MFGRTAIGSALLIFLVSWSTAAQAQATITTVAGINWVLAGERDPQNIRLLRIPALAVSPDGDLLVADSESSVVFRVPRGGGPVSIVAGTGERGSTGDGGPATSARLDRPNAVVADPSGNIYIADRYCRIRRVTPDGVMTAFAAQVLGLGSCETRALAMLPVGTVVTLEHRTTGLQAIWHSAEIYEIRPDGTRSPIASNHVGPSDFPWTSLAVARDGGIYITHRDRRVYRLMGPDSLIPVAGNGESGDGGDFGPALNASFRSPQGLAFGADGSLYVSDPVAHRVRRITTEGTITGAAGGWASGFAGDGGFAIAAVLSSPAALATDPDGNVFIGDAGNQRVRRVDLAGRIATIAGSGSVGDFAPAFTAALSNPSDLAFDSSGNLYIADTGNHRIRKVSPDGIITTVAGTGQRGYSGDGGPGWLAQLSSPYGVAVDLGGNVFIADTANGRIRKLDRTGIISTLAGNGDNFGFSFPQNVPATEVSVFWPERIAVSPAGEVYFSGFAGLRRVDTNGYIHTESMFSPDSLCFDGAGWLYVGSFPGGVSRTLPNGSSETLIDWAAANRPIDSAVGLALDHRGNLYVSDSSSGIILRRPGGGGAAAIVAGRRRSPGLSGDGGPATAAQLLAPQGIAVDAAGDLYIADSGNNRVRKVTFLPAELPQPVPPTPQPEIVLRSIDRPELP